MRARGHTDQSGGNDSSQWHWSLRPRRPHWALSYTDHKARPCLAPTSTLWKAAEGQMYGSGTASFWPRATWKEGACAESKVMADLMRAEASRAVTEHARVTGRMPSSSQAAEPGHVGSLARPLNRLRSTRTQGDSRRRRPQDAQGEQERGGPAGCSQVGAVGRVQGPELQGLPGTVRVRVSPRPRSGARVGCSPAPAPRAPL